MGDPLSQEEIDKLLDQSSSGSADAPSASEGTDQQSMEDSGGKTTLEDAAAAPRVTETPGEADEAPEDSTEPQGEPVLQVVDGNKTAKPEAVSHTRKPKAQPEIVGAATGSNPITQPVQFGTLPSQGNIADEARSINLLLDVQLQLKAELGRKELTIREALSLGPGSVVELNRLAGEPVDLFVNNKLIARGEVVVIDENFGVRVTDVVNPAERIG